MGENQFAQLYALVVAEKAKRKAKAKEGKPKRLPPTRKNVVMSKEKFVEEHKGLVKTLQSGTNKEQKVEATEQKKELKKVPGLAKVGKKEV